ncbi:SSU ribosomal protein S2p (SAe) [Brevinematales bacterium NS]|jgi:small subunit ribosomal protein S2|nr:SSU ribosomal protein S2p (SAe) [Brevinematales bacterium NS]
MASLIYQEKELMNALLEAGVHFGHQTKRWNPKMKPFIYTKRNGIYIIDLRHTMDMLQKAYQAAKELAANDGVMLFVGTKKQAQTSILEEATRCNMPYVTKRWLGGTLTNFSTIKKSIDKMKKLEAKLEADRAKMTKKEAIDIERTIAKMKGFYEGIRDMKRLPDALWVVDVKREINAVLEARSLGIKVFGIADTNCDPDLLDYPVPANDDAIRSVKLITSLIADAIIEGSTMAAKQESHIVEEEEEETEAVNVEDEYADVDEDTLVK